MSNLRDLSGICRDQGIKNLWLVGYFENGFFAKEFHPLLWWIYAEFHTVFVRFEAINEWHIKFDIVPTIARDFEVDKEDEFATMPIGSLFLPTVQKESHRVSRFEALLDEGSNLDAGIIKCGGFVLESGETIFFDPSNPLGFRIGTATQVRQWTSNLHHPMESYKSVSTECNQ